MQPVSATPPPNQTNPSSLQTLPPPPVSSPNQRFTTSFSTQCQASADTEICCVVSEETYLLVSYLAQYFHQIHHTSWCETYGFVFLGDIFPQNLCFVVLQTVLVSVTKNKQAKCINKKKNICKRHKFSPFVS